MAATCNTEMYIRLQSTWPPLPVSSNSSTSSVGGPQIDEYRGISEGFLRDFSSILGNFRDSKRFSGILRDSQIFWGIFEGFLRDFLSILGNFRDSKRFSGILRDSQGYLGFFRDFWWFLEMFLGILKDLLRCQRFWKRDSKGFFGILRDSQGFLGILRDSNGSNELIGVQWTRRVALCVCSGMRIDTSGGRKR